MNKDQFIKIFKESLGAITAERFYETERGYQGQLLIELDNRFKREHNVPNQTIIEQEYQKTLPNHGIDIRPDIIFHIPHEAGVHQDRRDGNFVVIECKLKATQRKAIEDFNNLDLMFEKLNYPLGIFLNIDSDKTFYEKYTGRYKNRLCCFAVQLVDGKVKIIEHGGRET